MSFKIVLSGLGLGLAVWSCVPYCESVSSVPQTVCHLADAGLVAADSPFVLQGQTFARSGTCSVQVDGGQISLSFTAMVCGGPGNAGRAAPEQASLVPCNIPALPAGSYTVNSSTPLTFTVPEAADGGLPTCP